uniref:Glycoprotein n=1 Tax=Haemonchus contortus TaxID=6289 RepID=A0A7I4YQX1_HAECO
MLPITFLILSSLLIVHVSGQSAAQCDNERNDFQKFISQSPQKLKTVFNYVLKGKCMLYFSEDTISPSTFSQEPPKCKFQDYRPIIFRWDQNSIGIVMVKGTTAYCSVIDVEGLISKGSSSVKLGEDSAENPFPNVEGKISHPMDTCHRKHDQPLILCFTILKNERILKTAISYQPGGTPRVIDEKEIRVPHVIVGHESVSIASYNSENNEDILAILDELNEVFVVHIKDGKVHGAMDMYAIAQKGTGVTATIVYADAYGLVSRKCPSRNTKEGCSFRFNILFEEYKSYVSNCMYMDTGEFIPGVILKSDLLTTTITSTTSLIPTLEVLTTNTTMPIEDGNETSSSSSPTEFASLETNATEISNPTSAEAPLPSDSGSDNTPFSNDTQMTPPIEVTSASTINNDTISTSITNDTSIVSGLGNGTEATETAATWQPVVTTNETETTITTDGDEDIRDIGNATQTVDVWAHGLLQMSTENQQETTVHKTTEAVKMSRDSLKCANQGNSSRLLLFPRSSTIAYFALQDSCGMYFSKTHLLEHQFQKNGIRCPREVSHVNVFDWHDRIGIIALKQKLYYFGFMTLNTTMMTNHQYKYWKVDTDQPLRRIYGNMSSPPTTCNGQHKKNEIYCYYMTPGKTHVVKIKILVEDGDVSANLKKEKKIRLPPKTFYEGEIAAYTAKDGANHLWVMHRNNLLYNFNLDEMEDEDKSSIKTKFLYRIPDDGIPYTDETKLVYANTHGFVTKRCVDSLCYYVFHSADDPNDSKCLFNTTYKLIPGILMKTPRKQEPVIYGRTLPLPPVPVNERSYVPIMLLGFITFIYLCFFFFFAFKPHPHSNLAELSSLVEDEISHLSILTKKAVKSMRKHSKAKELPPLILMKLPDESTQPSLEDLPCPGQPRDTYPPQMNPNVTAIPPRPVQSHDTLIPHRRVFNTNAKSNTTIPDQGNPAQLRSIRQLKHSTMSAHKSDKKGEGGNKADRRRPSSETPNAVIKAPVRSV